MSKLLNLFSVLALGAASLGALAAPACSPEAFEIISKTGRMDTDYLIVVGKVKNNNATACGVQLKTELFDKQKNLVDIHESWPASISNIAPGATYSFKLMIQRQRSVTSYRVEPVRARAW